jgi:predicted acylesterase/phospholipase RssA
VYGHTGFLRALTELGLTVAAGAGCSAGAVVGAIHASGGDMAAWGASIAAARREDFWRPDSPLRLLWALGVQRGRGWLGLADTGPAIHFVSRHLGTATFEGCRYPFRCVALSIGTGASSVFDTGELAPRAIASAAMPVLYRPVALDGDLYCDGALVTLAPTEAICCRFGLDLLIVHHVSVRRTERPELGRVLTRRWSLLSMLHRVLYRQQPWYLGERPLSRSVCPCGCGAPVMVVEPNLPELDWPLTAAGPAIEEAAYQQGLQVLPQALEAARQPGPASPAPDSRSPC